AIAAAAHGPNTAAATSAKGALESASSPCGTMPITSTEEITYTTPAMVTPHSVARGTSRSGSRTTPATMAPVSSPTKAQKIGASEVNTTLMSDSPDTFQAAS